MSERWARRDIITSIIDWMMANESAITEELALRAEHAARAEWGGQQLYLARTSEVDRRARQAAERRAHVSLLGPAPIERISRDSGISRRTLYRLARRGPPEG